MEPTDASGCQQVCWAQPGGPVRRAQLLTKWLRGDLVKGRAFSGEHAGSPEKRCAGRPQISTNTSHSSLGTRKAASSQGGGVRGHAVCGLTARRDGRRPHNGFLCAAGYAPGPRTGPSVLWSFRTQRHPHTDGAYKYPPREK